MVNAVHAPGNKHPAEQALHLDILVAAGRLEADVTDTHTPTDPEDA